MRVLEDRSTHALVQDDDGDVTLIPWSEQNKLIYKHGLHGLLVAGDEIVQYFTDSDDVPTVRLYPLQDDDSGEFRFEYGVLEFTLQPHDRSTLIETLYDVHSDDDPSPEPFTILANSLADTDVNPEVVNLFLPLVEASIPDGASVEADDSGWLINGHVHLSYDRELHHPHIAIESAYPNAERMGSGNSAYDISVPRKAQDTAQLELGDFEYSSMSESLIDFLARALWTAHYAPKHL